MTARHPVEFTRRRNKTGGHTVWVENWVRIEDIQPGLEFDVNIVSDNTSSSSKHSGISGEVVAGSRWQASDTQEIAGASSLIIQSPEPTASQYVVVDWVSFTAQVIVNISRVLSVVEIKEVVSNIVLWNSSIGFVASAVVGSTIGFDNSPVILGAIGQRLELEIPVAATVTLGLTANFGGYLVE